MPEAVGALTVALADSPTTQARRARPESSTESTFAEVLADSPTAQARRARPESSTESTFAEVLADSPTAQARRAGSESSTESTFAEVLADVMQVERVSVDSNFFDDLGADSMVMARFCARVRKRPDLPAVSIKDIYQHRTIRSLAAALVDTAPMPVERVFAEVLADVMQVERVSVDSNFFDDLGADSMVMARFCARVRKRPDLPAVSIKDIYQHPTIKSLATALADDSPVAVESAAATSVEVATPAPSSVEVAAPARTSQVVLCGALQLLTFLGYSYLAALVVAQGYEWISAGSGVLDIYVRSVISGCALFLFLFTVPIAGEVDPDRSLEAAADPHLEPGVRPVLGCQDAGAAQPGRVVHRFAAVQPLSAGAGREGRAWCGDLVQSRAHLHRSAQHR